MLSNIWFDCFFCISNYLHMKSSNLKYSNLACSNYSCKSGGKTYYIDGVAGFFNFSNSNWVLRSLPLEYNSSLIIWKLLASCNNLSISLHNSYILDWAWSNWSWMDAFSRNRALHLIWYSSRWVCFWVNLSFVALYNISRLLLRRRI